MQTQMIVGQPRKDEGEHAAAAHGIIDRAGMESERRLVGRTPEGTRAEAASSATLRHAA
jgi:hypothetical protein